VDAALKSRIAEKREKREGNTASLLRGVSEGKETRQPVSHARGEECQHETTERILPAQRKKIKTFEIQTLPLIAS